MSNLSLDPGAGFFGNRQRGITSVWIFCVVTVVVTLSLFFLLPSFAGVVIGVFVPTITAVVLIAVTGGKSQVRARLFSAKAWHLSLKWLLISLGLGLTLRLGVMLLGLLVVPDYQWQPGPFSPLLLAPFLFAAGEQIGWRGFALPTTLTNGYRPLAAALILGLPWALLQPAIASFARVVAYDRPGLGWSESPPDGQPHDALGNARALHTALVNAGLPGPYVLVGHSAGGINILVFAATFPEETGGLVLLDSTHPDQFLRHPPKQAQAQKRVAQMITLFDVGARLGILRLMNGPHFLDADELAPDQRAALQAYFATPRFAAGIKAESAAWEQLTFPQARAVKDLGAVPVVALTAGETAAQVPVQIELHRELANLSSNNIHRVVEGASYAGLASHSEFQPQVTGDIRQVLDAVQTGMPLEDK